jgi:hypothetical protein
MNGKLFFAGSVCLLTWCVAPAAPEVSKGASARRPMALMIMLDGWRADATENGRMPNARRLAAGKWCRGYNGAYTLTALTVPDAGASSAANHASIATGVTAAKSTIRTNRDFNRKNLNWDKWPSWLARLVKAQPGKKALFAYSWRPDRVLSPAPGVDFLFGKDLDNGKEVARRLASAAAPDATLLFIDYPDHLGHKSGFYPSSAAYLDSLQWSDAIVGDCLKAVSSRATFEQEDWLILLVSDHGGYARTHGLFGGHATTIPLILAGRNITPGRLPGVLHNYDLAPTALAHFGIDVSGLNLDGKVLTGGVAPEKPRAWKDALAVYLPFDDGRAANGVSTPIVPELRGKTVSGVPDGLIGGCLRVAPQTNAVCGVRLAGSERLAFENGADFAMTLWVRMPAPQKGDPSIVSNKDWRRGRNPGMVLVAAKKTESVKVPGVCFNCGRVKGGRVDIGTYDVIYGQWTFYAVTRARDGVLRVYQGGDDGRLYCIVDDGTKIVPKTGLPFFLGQDGTGRYVNPFVGDIDEFALWTRSLTHEDVRRVYEAGRRGDVLAELF